MKQFFISGVLLIFAYYGSIYISVEKVILSAEILTDFRSVISTPTNINMESFARASLHLIFLILFLFFLFEWRIVVIVVYLNDLKKGKKILNRHFPVSLINRLRLTKLRVTCSQKFIKIDQTPVLKFSRCLRKPISKEICELLPL